MARKLPLGDPLSKIKDTAFGAVKDPKGTSGKLIGQARGAASVGLHLAEGVASHVAGQVTSRARGRRPVDAPRAEPAPRTPAPAAPLPRLLPPRLPPRRRPLR